MVSAINEKLLMRTLARFLNEKIID